MTPGPGRPARILHIISSAVIGGAEACYLQMLEGLAARGHDTFAVCSPGGELFEMSEKALSALEGRRVFTAGMRDNADIFSLLKLYSIIMKVSPDVCHLHMNRATLLGALAARLVGVPSLGTIQGEVRPLYAAFPDRLTFCSRNVAAHVRDRSAKVAAKPSYFLYNRIDNAAVGAKAEGGGKAFLESEFGIPASAFVVCEVARLHRNKGQDHLIKAIAHNYKRGLDLYGLIVGGGDDAYMERLSALAGSEGCRERIVFAGTRLDVPKILAGTDLFALPSLQEGIPVTIMEALSLAVPVLAYDVGGIRELCETSRGNEPFITFAEPENIEAFAGAIGEIASRPEPYRASAAAAAAHMRERFDRAAYISEVEAIYRDMLKKSAFCACL